MLGKAAAAVKLDGGVAMVDFEVEDLGAVLAEGAVSEVEELRANSLPAMGALDKELVDPGAFAAIFEAVIEADHEIADGARILADDVDDAIGGILQEFGEVGANGGLVEGFFPGIVELHVAHHHEEGFEISEGGLGDGDGHGFLVR